MKNQNQKSNIELNIDKQNEKRNANVDEKSIELSNIIDEKLTIESIAKNDNLRQTYIDKLLLQLSNDSTSKIDKKSIRRFLRSLNHRNGLRNTKYSKSKTLFDFIK